MVVIRSSQNYSPQTKGRGPLRVGLTHQPVPPGAETGAFAFNLDELAR